MVTLDRPKVNALSRQMQNDIGQVARDLSDDTSVRAVVFYGGDRNFAAGADIKEMVEWDRDQAWQQAPGLHIDFDAVAAMPQPTIAAVTGYALGGGCELALCCDIRIAADNATFGQPEILLGIIPGAGGTQRLPRAISKAKAMDMCLTARMMDAAEAERSGLVSRIVPLASLMEETMKAAQAIASMSLPIAMMTKESVNRSYETTLAEGIRFERRVFHSLFATEDQKEGMKAFVEKRKPAWKHR